VGALKKKKRGHLELMIDLKDTGKGYSLTCQIQQARSLLPMDLNGLADAYVKMYIQVRGPPALVPGLLRACRLSRGGMVVVEKEGAFIVRTGRGGGGEGGGRIIKPCCCNPRIFPPSPAPCPECACMCLLSALFPFLITPPFSFLLRAA